MRPEALDFLCEDFFYEVWLRSQRHPIFFVKIFVVKTYFCVEDISYGYPRHSGVARKPPLFCL